MKPQVKAKPKKVTVECLSCSEDIYVGRNPKVGSFVTCDNCDVEFEIIDLEPVMVDWPYFEDALVDTYGYYGDEEGRYDDINDSNETYD